MKKSKKNKVLIIVGIILLAVILLVPVPLRIKDGGSVEYKAVLYSVTDWHAMAGQDSNGKMTYVEGISIKILGIEIFDNADWSLLYRYE